MVSAIEQLDSYLAGGNRFQLTAEEEQAAFDRGDMELLAKSQLPWVVTLASRMSRRYEYKDLDGLIAAGNYGLVLALQTFDPRRARLTTYSARRINWSMWEEMTLQRQGVGPTKWIAKRSKLGNKVELWGSQPPDVDSMHSPQGFIEDSEYQRMRALEVREAIAKLPKKQSRVIELRFLQGMTFQEIGDELGVSRQAAQQTQAAAMERLRTMLA